MKEWVCVFSESQTYYQFIRMNRSFGGGGGRAGGRGVELQRWRRGEKRDFLDVQSRAVRLAVSIRAGQEMAAAASSSPILLFISRTRGKIACVSSPWRSSLCSYQMMLRQARLSSLSPSLPLSLTHTSLCCCIGFTHRLSHRPKFGNVFLVRSSSRKETAVTKRRLTSS